MASEDLTTWVETDGGGDLTVTADKVDVVTQLNNVTNRVTLDRGVGYYTGDFDHDFEHNIIAGSGEPSAFFIGISTGLSDLRTGFSLACYFETGNLTPYLIDQDSGAATDAFDAGSNLSASTLYYSSLSRVGNILYWDIYSNASRTTLVQSMNITIVNTTQNYRYAYAMSGDNDGSSTSFTYFVQNIDFKEDTPLIVQGCNHSIAADSPALTQANTLVVQDAAQAVAVDSPALVQANTLVVADALHSVLTDNITLELANILAVNDALHSVAADSPSLTQANILVVADASHNVTVDNITLDFSVSLIVSDALHSVAADSPVLTQQNILTIQNALHAVALDNVSITQANTLVVANTLHSNIIDNILLSIPSGAITPLERIFLIPGEDRTFIIASEDRIFLVESEDRIFKVTR